MILPVECSSSTDDLVQHRYEREDVGPRIQLLPFDLFGGHVLHCSENGTYSVSCVWSSDRSMRPGARVVFARPKSSSFAPDGVIMTLPGLRSRWMMPALWSAAHRLGNLDAVLEYLVQRTVSRDTPHRERSPPGTASPDSQSRDRGQCRRGHGCAGETTRRSREPRARTAASQWRLRPRWAGITLMATVRPSRSVCGLAAPRPCRHADQAGDVIRDQLRRSRPPGSC